MAFLFPRKTYLSIGKAAIQHSRVAQAYGYIVSYHDQGFLVFPGLSPSGERQGFVATSFQHVQFIVRSSPDRKALEPPFSQRNGMNGR